MEERDLIESLLEGPRAERDLPGNGRAKRKLIARLEKGSDPIITLIGGLYALTPAGYEYAEKIYNLVPTPIDEEDKKLQRSIDSLNAGTRKPRNDHTV